MVQEKALRSQAEQGTIGLLTQRKEWGAAMEAKVKEAEELKKSIAAMEEEQEDMTLELKVGVGESPNA